MSKPGWYPDPGGAPGMMRYWDGASWSTAVSAQPPGLGRAPSGLGGTPSASGSQPLTSRTPTPSPYAAASGRRPAPRTSALKQIGWLGLVLLVIGALVFGGLQLLNTLGINPLNPTPASNPTINPCPPEPITQPTPISHPADGRVHGGKLSYPTLGFPWAWPHDDPRLPFGRDVAVQEVMVEQNYNGKGDSWVASVLVGELIAGDGFFSPKEGAELIARCAMARFYGDAVVTRNDLHSESVLVSGKAGWVIETHLTFDIPGLNEKGETAIFLVVPTSDTASSIFYASIPDSVPDLLVVARSAKQMLQIDP